MSTTSPRSPVPHKQEIRIVSHSPLFYWWPVWAVGFIMTLISWLSNRELAVVPVETSKGVVQPVKVEDGKVLAKMSGDESKEQTINGRTVLIAPEKKDKEVELTRLHLSDSKSPGVLFCTVLLLVIAISNIPMRGLWSVIIIIFIVFLSIIFAITHVWDDIFRVLSFLDIRINMGGYLFISAILFVIWLVVFFLFDQQIYMVFTPGQFRVRLEIGEGETSYDTTGMTVQKQRSDLFRHWILGLGSGDLVVRTAGAQAHHFDLPNVLFLGRKVKEIEELLRSRQVVAGS